MNITLSSEQASVVIVKKEGMKLIKHLDFDTFEQADAKLVKILNSLAFGRNESFRLVEGDVDTYISKTLVIYVTKKK